MVWDNSSGLPTSHDANGGLINGAAGITEIEVAQTTRKKGKKGTKMGTKIISELAAEQTGPTTVEVLQASMPCACVHLLDCISVPIFENVLVLLTVLFRCGCKRCCGYGYFGVFGACFYMTICLIADGQIFGNAIGRSRRSCV